MDFVKFALQRILRMILCLIAVSVLTFTLLQLAPGNFADINSATSGSTGMDTGSTEQIGQQFNDRYGDDVPVVQQYLIFMKGAATWDMGPSYKYPNRTVEGMIAQGFPVSATLAVLAVALALALSIPIGVIAALRHRKLGDTGTMFLVTLGHALPSYLSAVFLIIIFAGWLQVLPAGGWAGPQNMIMPVLAMGLGPLAVLSRYVRSAMLDTLSEEYVTAAYAKGGKPSTVVITHVLRNSLIPLITVSGPMLAGLMTGTLFIETMFRIPGLGLMFTQAAAARDMPLLMGSTMFFAIILMVTNLLVDLVYGLIDPRIRAESGRRLRVNTDSRGPSEKAQDSVTVASNLG